MFTILRFKQIVEQHFYQQRSSICLNVVAETRGHERTTVSSFIPKGLSALDNI